MAARASTERSSLLATDQAAGVGGLVVIGRLMSAIPAIAIPTF